MVHCGQLTTFLDLHRESFVIVESVFGCVGFVKVWVCTSKQMNSDFFCVIRWRFGVFAVCSLAALSSFGLHLRCVSRLLIRLANQASCFSFGASQFPCWGPACEV